MLIALWAQDKNGLIGEKRHIAMAFAERSEILQRTNYWKFAHYGAKKRLRA